MVLITGNGSAKPRQDPAGISGRTEKHSALVVIETGDMESKAAEMQADFRPDEPAGACDEGAAIRHVRPQNNMAADALLLGPDDHGIGAEQALHPSSAEAGFAHPGGTIGASVV